MKRVVSVLVLVLLVFTFSIGVVASSDIIGDGDSDTSLYSSSTDPLITTNDDGAYPEPTRK